MGKEEQNGNEQDSKGWECDIYEKKKYNICITYL